MQENRQFHLFPATKEIAILWGAGLPDNKNELGDSATGGNIKPVDILPFYHGHFTKFSL